MAIKIIRICDICEEEYPQIEIYIEAEQTATYPVKFICSSCELKIGKLVDAAAKENNNNGISCVSTVISYLFNNRVKEAKAVYQNEADKIREYPKVQDWFYEIFGCPLHLRKNCPIDLCIQLRKYNDEKLS